MELAKKKNISMICMAVTAVMWSTGGFFIKLIPWNPIAIAAPRCLIAALILLAYIKVKGGRVVINRGSLATGFCLGMVTLTYLTANKLTTAANAIMLQYVSPVFILLISVFFFHQRCRRLDIFAVAATLAGISLFFLDQLSLGNMLGNVIALLGGVCWAWAFVLSAEADEETRMSGVFLAQLFSGLVGLPVMLLTETPLSPVIAAGAVGLGVVQLGLPYIFFNLAMRNCSALMCNLIGTLEPLLNPVWVFLLLGEKPGPFALLGSLVVIFVVTVWCTLGQQVPAPDLPQEEAA